MNLNIIDKLHKITISSCRTHHLFEGKKLYSRLFCDVEKFHNPGFAPVLDSESGYHINIYGQALYHHRFDKTFGFYCSRAAVVKAGKYYHINSKGEAVYDTRYDWVGNYQEEYCVVRVDNKFFHIDINGDLLYGNKYDYAGDFKDNVAVIYQNNLASHIDNTGGLIHNKWYKKLGIFHKGYANAEDNKGWFHINRHGEEIYSQRYKMVEPFYNGLAKVETFEGELLQISIDTNTKHVISAPTELEQVHSISKEMVGFWYTYLLNGASETDIFNLLPAHSTELSRKLQIPETNLLRFLRALWEAGFICYDNNSWHLTSKSQIITKNPFLLKAAKMWGKVIIEENWLNLPKLLKQSKQSSLLSFKETELDEIKQSEFYEALIGYSLFDFKLFDAKVELQLVKSAILFGVHSIALIKQLKKHNIQIDYHNDFTIPLAITDQCDINFVDYNQILPQYDIAILARFLQHLDDNKVISYLKMLDRNKISRILLLETILEDNSPLGGIIDINIMVETRGKLRSVDEWKQLLNKVNNKLHIQKIIRLTNYLSVIDITRV
ncbi:MAG: hypothetical protein DGJ47_001079 [Rickettsiaceae bacterium]